MQSSRTPFVERPRIAFRVGISGTTSVEPEDRVRVQVADVLEKIGDEVHRCANAPVARRVYDLAQSPLLRLISPLADGADRLVAEVAINCGFQLETALPFEVEEYKATFVADTPVQHAASVERFETLLSAAQPRVLTMDGERRIDTDRWRSYEAVGRLVVRNCDLLIAIWDDEKPPHGRGGTADIVQYALRGGIPVWWIHVSGEVQPRWLDDILDLPRPAAGELSDGQAQVDLRKYVVKAILPPELARPEAETTWHRIKTGQFPIPVIQADPLLAFLQESGKQNRRYWNLHLNYFRTLGSHGVPTDARCAAQELEPAPPASEAARTEPHGWLRAACRFLTSMFRRNRPDPASSPAAGLSAIYRDRYRTSYTVVFTFGALALISAIVGLAYPAVEHCLVVIELVLLLIIVGFVGVNRLRHWHERYISYRMLGELLRMSKHLRCLGWDLPGSRVNNLAHGTRRDWVYWFFAATVRATSLVAGGFAEAELAVIKHDIMENLIDGQLRFHDSRQSGCAASARFLGNCGRVFFFLTLVFVLTRVILFVTGLGHVAWLALFCAVLPAASAAFFGLRAYEELEVLIEQSEQMQEALITARERIGRIVIHRPLASQVLGTELFQVTTIMLSDVAGWAQLFRMKPVDT